MAGNASIVVDIKAQITGYEEQIAKIKEAMKKVDPGSAMGKSLMKTLEQADQKLTSLQRKAEQRITSQGQLEHLFDQLHTVNDLVNNMGRGLSQVGMNDVLETSSEAARTLGRELLTVKNEMQQKGKTFFDSFQGEDAKKLQAVFDSLSFDPKKMGVDEFMKRFNDATNEASKKVNDLSQQQEQVNAKAAEDAKILEARGRLDSQLQKTSGKGIISSSALKTYLGTEKFTAQGVTDAQNNAQIFLDQVRAGLENDQRDSKQNSALEAAIQSTSKNILNAKNEGDVLKALNALNAAIMNNTQNGTESQKSLSSIMGNGFDINDWANKLTAKAEVDADFINKIESVADVLKSNASTAQSGQKISDLLYNLIDEQDVTTFKNHMDNLINEVKSGINSLNQAANTATKEGNTELAKKITDDLNKAKTELSQLETIKNNPEFANFQSLIDNLSQRISTIESKLGIESNANKEGTVKDIQNVGDNVLKNTPPIADESIQKLKQYGSMLENVQQRQQMVGKVEGIAQRWFSVYAAVRMVGKAFRTVKQNVTNLDKTMTEIAIVTNKSQSDLWGQMPEYTAMARKYGASLQGVYEVSQLYYQQGLEQNDVMALTEQTLKMARISGLDYTDATNYMTNAIRSFKIEMQDSQRVVDVYSALAASSASSTTELATAMSKTASSAAAVGSSFENTSAMMAVMIETTRESPENIGSALKSIISRYGELKENKTGIDEEGEEYSLNKVDTALQSVGISIHDAKGEFRDFDDVITELSGKWDTIDKNTQRYIATVMAGNRQQSRFLALVSNGERLAELSETAANSEDAATLQVLKTMDSIDYKSQQLQTTLQSLYTSTGVETFYKGILDGANQIVKTFTDMPTLFNLPIPAMMSVATNFVSMANIVMTTLSVLKQKFTAQWNIEDAKQKALRNLNKEEEVALERATEEQKLAIKKEYEAKRQALVGEGAASDTAAKSGMKTSSKWALGAQLLGTGLNLASGLVSDKGRGNRAVKAGLGIGGSALQYGALGFQLSGHPAGAVIGGLLGAGMGLWQNFQYIFQSTADQAKRLKEEAEEAQTEYKQKNATAKNIEKEIANVKKLAAAQYDSTEAREKYIEASNKLAQDLPELVSHYDEEGNAVIDLTNAYDLLAEKRRDANEAATESIDASIEAARKNTQAKNEKLQTALEEASTGTLNYKGLEGKAKDQWTTILNTASTMKGENGQFDIFNKLKDIEFNNWGLNTLSGLIKDQVPTKGVPGLSNMIQQMQTVEGRETLGNDLLTQRDDMVARWRKELDSGAITDAFTYQILDFMIGQLESNGVEIMKASGEAAGAEASERGIIKSSVADYVNRYRQMQSDIVNYSDDQKAIQEAQKQLDLFTDLNNTSEIMTNFIMQKFIDSGKTWKDFETGEEHLLDEARAEAIKLLSGLDSTQREAVNELFKNREQYTEDEFRNKLQKITENNETTDAIMEAQASYYRNLLDNEGFQEALETRNKNTENQFKLSGLEIEREGKARFSGQELQSILSTYDKINSMYQHGNLTQQNGRNFLNAYNKLWNESNDAQQNILSQITDFSEEGLKDINEAIDNSQEFDSPEAKEAFKAAIAALFGYIPENVNTAIENYTAQMATATEDYNKDLSSATKGMDYKAAAEMAKKLGIQVTDEYFDSKDGELFLKDTQLLYDHYFGENGITNSLREKVQQSQKNLEDHASYLKSIQSGWDQRTEKEKHTAEVLSGLTVNEIDALFKDFEKSGETDFYAFIKDYYTKQIEGVEGQFKEYQKSAALKQAIDSGKTKDLAEAMNKTENQAVTTLIQNQLQKALKDGDFEYFTSGTGKYYITDEAKQKLPELKTSQQEAQKSVLNSLIDSTESGLQYIEANIYNTDLLQAMEKAGLAKLNKRGNEVLGATLDNSVENIDQVYEFIEDYGTPLGLPKVRETLAQLHQKQYELTKSSTFTDIMKEYNNIGEVMFEEFAEAWKDTDISGIFQQQADGSYKANLPKLAQFAREHMSELDELAQQQIEETLTKAIDDGMTSITSASDYVTKGTTKYSDMTAFVKQFNEALPGAQATIQDLFGYDKDAQGYILDPQKYRDYLTGQKQMLQAMGESTEYIDGLIQNANQSIYDAIDIKSYLDAESKGTKTEPSKARSTLKKQIMNANIRISDSQLYSESWLDYLSDNLRAKAEVGERIDPHAEQTAKEYAEHFKQVNNSVREEAANQLIDSLDQGGIEAVNAMQAIATLQGKELTSADIESAYKAQVSQIEAASEQLSLGVGSLVTGDAIQMLQDAGFKLQAMGDGNTAVINQIGEISDAYATYYDALKQSGEATLEALNQAKAKVLETKDGRQVEQSAIDALGSASGMTYSTFAELLTDMGIELTDQLIAELESAGIIEGMGGNKMRIKNFAAFARRMKWDYNSEEYLSGFSQFNDGLVEQSNKNKKAAIEELDKLKEANPGDLLNLTYTMEQMQKEAQKNNKDFSKKLKRDKKDLAKAQSAYEKNQIQNEINQLESRDYITQFTKALANTGAMLKDSVLHLNNANKLDVATVLQDYASFLGPEIADLGQAILTSYTDAITKGIEGGMTNVEASDLTKMAQDMGIVLPDNAFQQTAEGLQLSSDYAIQIYEAISNVDALQGNLVFKSLSESLKKNNRNYKTANKLLTYANRLQRQLTDETEKTGKKQDDLNDKLEAERKLAKKSAMDAYGNAEEDWDFRNEFNLPDDAQNMIDYYTAWASLYGEVESSLTSKRIDTDAMYDLVYGAEQIANATGEAREVMGKLIGGENGISAREALADVNKALRVDSKYGAYYDVNALQGLGWNFTTGAYGRTRSSVNAGIDKYFEGVQVDAEKWNNFAGGMVSLQEYMDQHNISAESLFGENGLLNYDQFTDMIDKGGFSEEWNKFAENMEVGNTKLSKALSNPTEFKNNAEEYSNAIRAILGMMDDEGWDNSDRLGSLASMMAKYNFNGKATVNGTTIISKNGKVVIQGKDKSGKTVVVDDQGNEYTGPNALQDAVSAMNQRELNDYINKFDKYKDSQDQKDITYTVDGFTYTIEVEGDHYKITKKNNGTGKEETSTTDDAEEAFYAGYSKEDKERGLTKEGFENYVTKQGSDYQYKKGLNNQGLITSTSREKLRSSGIQTSEQLQARAESLIKSLGKEKGLSQFEVETGIDINPTDVNVSKVGEQAEVAFKNIDWDSYINQSDLTQTAADVAAGIATAFGDPKVSQSISDTLKTALVNEETGEGIPIKVKPELEEGDPLSGIKSQLESESIPIKIEFVTDTGPEGGEGQTPETQDVDVDVNYKTGTIEDANIEDEDAKVNYKIGTIEKLKEQLGNGKIIWTHIVKPFTYGLSKSGTITWTHKEANKAPSGGGGGGGGSVSATRAIGTVGLAHAKSTLMGELGPELVVSNGRYFVVGQNGPEMVDLADDAIVFNHLQTQQLLEKGMSSGRGKAVTNERNAVAYAKGDINGGHAAPGGVAGTLYGTTGAGAINASTVLGNVATAGEAVTEALEAFIKKLDEWYNQLQEIAKIEEKITYQETLRSKIESDLTKNGKAYYESQKTTINDLERDIVQNQALAMQQQDYLNKRVQTLNSENSPWSKLYTIDSEGQVKYKDGMKEMFGEKFGATDANKPNYTPQEQYNWLISQGFGEFLKYDSNGKEIEFTDKEGKENQAAYKTAVESFWTTMENQLTEVQDLKDSIDEHQKAVLEAQQKQNELIAEMRDNQIELEEKVLNAIVDTREREIDELENVRDAYSESADKLVNGLTDALNKERDMYQMQDDQAETDKMRRRLAILQSSGGSASEIIDLEEQIRQRDRDMYFEEQQRQIDAIKEASDRELERLDNQIDLQKELLDYQKEHGLLWTEVYNVMEKSPEDISNFIMQNTKEFWGNSMAKNAETADDLVFSATKWAGFREDMKKDLTDPFKNLVNSILTNNGKKEWENYVAALKETYGEDFSKDTELYEAYMKKYKETSDPNQAAAAAKAILDKRGTKTATEKAAEAEVQETASNVGGSISFQKANNGSNNTYSYSYVDAEGAIHVRGGFKSQEEAIAAAKKSIEDAAKIDPNKSTSGYQDNEAQKIKDTISVTTNQKNTNKGKAAVNMQSIGTTSTGETVSNAGSYYMKKYNGKVTGNAFAKGTLLGELGPEAWIANGKLHIAGQYGAEMVNLPNDAIVFNHQQTARLLRTGKAGRGNAINGEDAALGNKERNSYISTFWDQVARNRASMESINYPSYTTSSSLERINNELQNNNTNEAITIEHAEVNMNVEQLANDYDAKRAGEQALQEMLRIARKGSVTTVRR